MVNKLWVTALEESSHSTFQTALNIAATETVKWLVSGRNPSLESNLVTFNTLNLEKQDHPLVRRPQCPHCSDPQRVAHSQWEPLRLTGQKKIFGSDGGYRSIPPQQTWAQFSHHVSPITGIIRTLRKSATGENSSTLTPTYLSVHQFENNLFSPAESQRHSAYGKGKQPIQAKVSALCESIERYAGVFQGDEARIRAENILLGFGAHFDAQLAISRALTEVNQSLPADSAGLTLPQDSSFYQIRDRAEVTWWQSATVQNHPYLLPDEMVKPKIQADYSLYESDDLSSDVMACVQLAQAKGMETLVLDQTRPELGLHVVKVIVPGMRHFWPRFAPGRLYEVPVQMGWLSTPLTEEQLNPQPAFF